MRARYYDAALGRFISADTIVPGAGNPQALNRYSYVLNNPVRLTDPSGHGCQSYDDGECADPPPLPPPCQEDRCEGGSEGPPVDHVDWSLPTAEQAFHAYYTKLCGAVCEFTLKIAPPGLISFVMLIADEGGNFGGIPYRPQLTPAEKEIWMQQQIMGAVLMTGPLKAGAAPNFVVTPDGVAIPIPEGATGPFPAQNGKGFQFIGGSGGPGLSDKVSGVRIMDPTLPKGASPGYENGYVSYSNAAGLTVNPITGQQIGRSDPWWHIPIR